ncbi:MAG: hypothetical protein JXK94_04220 [Deltaproteobacteria bacterium]|nr:hypothetical protein [Deltaproteobacteria bacterium]
MEPRTKFIVYKIAGYAFMAWALYFFVKAFFLYREVADLAVTNIEFKMGMTQAVLKGAAGMGVGLVGFLFNYSAGLHKKDIDFL